jgi:NAD(P)-dependent dehydrogenase (short-subunit alcohol dehydrogenase family)
VPRITAQPRDHDKETSVSKLVTPFGFESTTSDVLRGAGLSGKTALVTGANSGIGYETARALASAGAAVAVAARRDRAGRDAAARIAASAGNPHVRHLLLDLADLDSVARAAAGWRGPLHILASNAGIMAVPELTRTAQGHELQFATNYLGHFALTAALRTALAAAGQARIVSLSSNAHLSGPVVFGDLDFRFRPYDPRQAYAESKTAAVLLAVQATRRWAGGGIYANAVNPGAIATGLQKHTGGLKTPAERRKSAEQGAATPVFLAASPLAEGIGGRYLEDVNEADTRTESPGMFGTGVADYALEPRYAELLWEVSAEMVAAGKHSPAHLT